MKNKKLSVPEKVLISAYKLFISGKERFTAEDLVISAWSNFPDTFGLVGYNHPNSNRVFAEIMGTKPIRKRGWLIKVGEKIYSLTESGRDYAASLTDIIPTHCKDKISLPRDIQNKLKMLLNSHAISKYLNNETKNISFYDACDFWGISPRSTAIEFSGKVSNIVNILEAALQEFKSADLAFEHGGCTISQQTIKSLYDLHEWLLRQFESDIKVIKSRTDERK